MYVPCCWYKGDQLDMGLMPTSTSSLVCYFIVFSNFRSLVRKHTRVQFSVLAQTPRVPCLWGLCRPVSIYLWVICMLVLKYCYTTIEATVSTLQAEKEEQTAIAEKAAVTKEQPDQWAPETVPQLQPAEVTDWAAETMSSVQPAIGGQFSMGPTVQQSTGEDWSATEDWTKPVPAATAPATGAAPTPQWGGDKAVENWN